MLEVGLGLIFLIGLVSLMARREESLPEEYKVDDVAGISYGGSLKFVALLFFAALILFVLMGAGG